MKKRNYYQIYLLVLAVAFAGTWGTGNAGVVTATFPEWARVVWYAGLAVGAGVAVAGELVFTNASLLVERAALLFLTGLIMAYTMAFLIQGARVSTVAHVAYVGIALVAFAAVNLSRANQIKQQIKDVHRVFAALPNARETT